MPTFSTTVPLPRIRISQGFGCRCWLWSTQGGGHSFPSAAHGFRHRTSSQFWSQFVGFRPVRFSWNLGVR